MGKIVKYCSNCDESFAEKFSYCPNCAVALSTYEMSPVPPPIKTAEPVRNGAKETKEIVSAAAFVNEPVKNAVTAEKSKEIITEPLKTNFAKPAEKFTEKVEQPKIVEPKPAIKETAPLNVAPAAVEDYNRTYAGQGVNRRPAETAKTVAAETVQPVKSGSDNSYYDNRGGYNITFVEEKDGGRRNFLLLGAFFFVSVLTISGLIYSLYNDDAFVGALIDDDVIGAIPLVDAPEEIKPEEPPKPKTKDDAGGGGGGGNKAALPTSKGVLATQVEKPFIAPSVTMDRVTKPAIPIQMATQGNRKEKPTDQPYGNPNAISTIPSDGTGSGGGQGEGIGRGQGNGRGTGAGNGIGSGNGNGIGDGNGNGRGSGTEGGGEPPAIKPKPAPPAGPTVALSILSKPRANYTDAARQNQVQGTVTLRVTFLASGAIGSISPVNGLPNGLTEQAIAAARAIKFEPAKKGGVPYTTTKQVQYNFTLY